ncbi:Alpha/Beta hydrolase protein [Phyllosticta citriasiana]|uniref:Carboxylic ester hydrolase n=1 Tax=Phyllosticta citriasiana TaxID=595635 RepID=A0ABR1KKS5_9PEZI
MMHAPRIAAIVALLVTATVSADPIVTVKNGSYSGLYLPQFGQDLFLGIPYAQDTGLQNRFRVPQSLIETWNGTRAAKHYSNACLDANPDSDVIYGMSENHLLINIVRPAGTNMTVGTSGLSNYNLTCIVEKSVKIGKPIIGASINYRKSSWGNMYSIELQGSGNTNLALRDMRKGLAWIQENVEAFGGDPGSVTIWGESSGSFAVGQLVLSYGARTDDLFHRSIQESGSAATAWYNGTEWYQPIFDNIVDSVNCSSAADKVECLRTIPYSQLYPFMNASTHPGPGFYPTVDGDIVPNYPTELIRAVGIINTDDDLRSFLLNDTGFDFPASTVDRIMELYPDDPAAGIPLNTGNERFADHGWQFKRAAAIMGDVFYHAPRLDDARHYADHAPTFVYRFNTRPFENATNATYTDYVGELAPAYKGVEHFSEVAFVFNNPSTVGPWVGYEMLSGLMSSLWIRFAHDGDPNGEGLPYWPRYNSGGNATGLNLVLQTDQQGGCYVEQDTYRLEGREFLTKWARRRHV